MGVGDSEAIVDRCEAPDQMGSRNISSSAATWLRDSVIGVSPRAISFLPGCFLSRWRRPRGARCDPGLSWNICRDRLSAEIRNHSPDCVGGEDSAVCRHSSRAAVEDRVINLAVGTSVTPASVYQTRTHPSESAAAMAPVTIHRAEKLFAVLDHLRIGSEWIAQDARRGSGSTGAKMRLISDGRRDRSRLVRARTTDPGRDDESRDTYLDWPRSTKFCSLAK